jgi:hypothetical protein
MSQLDKARANVLVLEDSKPYVFLFGINYPPQLHEMNTILE